LIYIENPVVAPQITIDCDLDHSKQHQDSTESSFKQVVVDLCESSIEEEVEAAQ